jgi:hypothetical protein
MNTKPIILSQPNKRKKRNANIPALNNPIYSEKHKTAKRKLKATNTKKLENA